MLLTKPDEYQLLMSLSLIRPPKNHAQGPLLSNCSNSLLTMPTLGKLLRDALDTADSAVGPNKSSQRCDSDWDALRRVALNDIHATTALFGNSRTSPASSSVLASAVSNSASKGLQGSGASLLDISIQKRTSNATDSTFHPPDLEEMYALQAFLSLSRSYASGSQAVAQWGAVLQRLQTLQIVKSLAETIHDGLEWYFSSSRECRFSGFVGHAFPAFGASDDDASSSAFSSSRRQQHLTSLRLLNNSTLPRSTAMAAEHSSAIGGVGVSFEDVQLLGLSMACDTLFLYAAHVTGITSSDEEWLQSPDRIDSFLALRASLEATPKKQRVSRHASSSTGGRTENAPMGTDEAEETCDFTAAAGGALNVLYDQIAGDLMVTSDAREGEEMIRRCGLSLLGFLICAQEAAMCSDTALPKESRSLIPSRILDLQVTRHCPSQWLLIRSTPAIIATQSVAPTNASEALPTLLPQAASSEQFGQEDDADGEACVAPPAAATVVIESPAQRTLQVAVEVLSTTLVVKQMVEQEAIYRHTYGDAHSIGKILQHRLLTPILRSFFRHATVDFWRVCAADTAAAFAFAAAVASGSPHNVTQWTASGDLIRMHEALSVRAEAVADDAVGETTEFITAAWIALHAAAVPMGCLTQSLESFRGVLESLKSLRLAATDNGTCHAIHFARVIASRAFRAESRHWNSESEMSSQSTSWLHHGSGGDVAVALVLFMTRLTDGTAGAAPDDETVVPSVDDASTLRGTIESTFGSALDMSYADLSEFISTAPLLTSPSLRSSESGCRYRFLQHVMFEFAVDPRVMRLQVTPPAQVLGSLLTEDLMRRSGASAFDAVACYDTMIYTSRVLQRLSTSTLAANVPCILHTLSQMVLEPLPFRLASCVGGQWVEMMTTLLDLVPVELSAALRSNVGDVLAARLLFIAGKISICAMEGLQSHIPVFGGIGTRMAAVVKPCLLILAMLSACGHADAVARHEVAWCGATHSVVSLLLTFAFQSRDASLVCHSVAVVMDALEHVSECEAMRRKRVVPSSEGGIGSSSTLDDGAQGQLLPRQKTEPDRAAVASVVLSALAADVGSRVSAVRLLLLKAIQRRDPAWFHHVFIAGPVPSGAALRGAALLQSRDKTKKEVTIDNPVKNGENSKDLKDDAKNNNSNSNKDTTPMIVRLLVDTIKAVDLPCSELAVARDRAESMEILRRLRNSGPLQLSEIMDCARRVTSAMTKQRRSSAIEDTSDKTASLPEADVAALLSAASRFIAQRAIAELQLHRHASAPKNNAVVRMSTPASPSTGLRKPASRSSSMTPPMGPVDAERRCPFIVTHGPLVDELIDSILSHASRLQTAMSSSVKDLHDAEAQLVEGGIHLSPVADFAMGRVGLQYGSHFVFECLTDRSRNVCDAANRCASLIDALDSMLGALAALVEVSGSDRDIGFLEKMLEAMECVLKQLPMCLVVHPALSWISEKLLQSWLAAARSIAACIRAAFVSSQSMPPSNSADTLQALLFTIPFVEEHLLSDGNFLQGYLMMAADLQDVAAAATNHHHHPSSSVNNMFSMSSSSTDGSPAVRGVSGTSASVESRILEIAVRALSLRDVILGGNEQQSSSIPLECGMVDAIVCVVVPFGVSHGSATAMNLMLQTITVHLKMAARRVRVTSTAQDNRDVELVSSLLQLMETCVYTMSSVESCASLCDMDSVLEDTLQLCVALGALPLDGFLPGVHPAQEMSWYRCWRDVLSVLRSWMIRLPAQETRLRTRIVSVLLGAPRVLRTLSGPRRPNALRTLSAAIDNTSTATYASVLISTELREMDLIWNILSSALQSSQEALSAMHHLFTSDIRKLMAFAFALLRKPGELHLSLKQPRNVDSAYASTSGTRDADLMCTSLLRHVCMALHAWSSLDTECCFASDVLLQIPSDTMWCRTMLLQQTEGSAWEWNVFAPPPSPFLPLLTLETLRDCVVSEMSAIKRIQREAMHASLASAQQTPVSVPPTPQIGCSSPGLRHIGDGCESVAESDVSWFCSESGPLALRAHMAAARASMDLFVHLVALRATKAASSGGRWSGTHREITEKMEITLRGLLQDAAKQQQHQSALSDSSSGLNNELVVHFEMAKKQIDAILKQTPK